MRMRRIIEKVSGVLAGLAVLAGSVRANPALPSIPSGVFNITNYGAVGDGTTTNTAAIQQTINAASLAGGGTVEVPAGNFLCGPLTLGSSIRFQLDSGATLLLPPYGSYPGGTNPADFITVDNAHDVEFCGPGVLNGQGSGWWSSGLDISEKPYELHLNNCVRVFIHDWNSMNPPMKHIVFDGTDSDITIQNATNTAPYPTPNTDCLNLQGSNCLVQNCVFYGGDDNIAMGRSSGSGVDILITNITCGTGHGISIGSITSAGISNVTVVNCTFSGTDNGLRLKADNDRGGVVQNINYMNITMTNVQAPIVLFSYYNEISPNSVTPAKAASYAPTNVIGLTPIWRNITFSNITATFTSYTELAGIIWGRSEMFVSNVTLSHVNITAPASFDIYNARGIKFVDSQITTPHGTTTFAIYNAGVTLTNSALGAGTVSFSGLTSSNSLSLYNAPASTSSTNLFNANPVTISGCSLSNSTALTLPSTNALDFVLGTNSAELIETGNMTLNGKINITSGGGFGPGAYTLAAYTGSFSGSPTLGTTPLGYNCSINTNTPREVLLEVSQKPPSITNLQIVGSILFASGTGGSASGNYYVLSSSNPALPLADWARLTTNQFNFLGNFSFSVEVNSNASQMFYALQVP